MKKIVTFYKLFLFQRIPFENAAHNTLQGMLELKIAFG